MKKILLFASILIFVLVSCKKNEDNKSAALAVGVHTVKVLEYLDVSNYTYLHVTENGRDYWIAAPQMKTSKEEVLYYSQSMEMKNFHSDALNRTFPVIYFVQSISSDAQQGQTMSSIHQGAGVNQKEKISIEPVKGGKTIEDVYSQSSGLSGQVIKVTGKVVKYNAGIMSRNWIHIQDGTEFKGNYDLLITSKDETGPGQVIVVEGKVAINKDFGAGYSYPVLLEDAKIITGKPI